MSPVKEKCDPAGDSCPQATEVADRAVAKVFAILGVDIHNPRDVEEFREDLRFGAKMRKIADHGLLALFGVIAAGLAAAVWAGITSKINGGH